MADSPPAQQRGAIRFVRLRLESTPVLSCLIMSVIRCEGKTKHAPAAFCLSLQRSPCAYKCVAGAATSGVSHSPVSRREVRLKRGFPQNRSCSSVSQTQAGVKWDSVGMSSMCSELALLGVPWQKILFQGKSTCVSCTSAGWPVLGPHVGQGRSSGPVTPGQVMAVPRKVSFSVFWLLSFRRRQ